MSDFGDVGSAPSQQLVRAVERGRRRLVRGAMVGLVLSVVLSAAGVLVVWKDRDAASIVFAAMQIGTVVAVMAFVSYSQRNAWRARSETTRGFLELEIERRRDWIRRMRFLAWGTPVLAAAVCLHHTLLARKHPGMMSGSVASALIGVAMPYLILAWFFWHAGRRKARFRREEATLMKQLAELEDEAISI